MEHELLDVKRLQETLRLSERTIFRLIKNGELRGFKVGREWRFEQSDVDEFIQRQRKKAEERIQSQADKDAA